MIRKQLRILFTLLFVFGLATFSLGQMLKNYNTDSLKNDFIFFRNLLNNNYPSLYRFTNKDKSDKLFDSCSASINPKTTSFDLYRMIKYVLSSIKDGHLYCGPSDEQRKYMNEQAKLFPMRLYFVGASAFVISSSNNSLSAGTEIISIDDRPIDQIRKELFRYIVSDGSIETKKYHILNSVFHFYYMMIYGEAADFKVTYRSTTGTVKTIKVNAVTSKEIPQEEKTEPKNLLQLSITGDVAILTVKTFDSEKLKEHKEDFSSFVENSFKEIHEKKINNLIIDLRDNGGGRGLYGSLLYSYLTDKPFDYYRTLTAATKNLPYEKFNSNSTSFNDLNVSMLEKTGNNIFLLKKEANDNLQVIEPNKNNFSGSVYFSINGLSFSTTAEFCAIAKSNNRGKFIGEETGGGYCGNTSGVMTDTILPYSKLNISFGTIQFEMAVVKTKYVDRGIIPDYEIIPSITDMLKMQDVQLDGALKLIKEKSRH